jgi:ubiquinone/menaquinone biosynthesis C-methylase UbiE
VAPNEPEILAYYAARANEYERVYAKPERQQDLRELHLLVPAYLAGRRVLDVPCGTGYWARSIARRAASVTGVDLAPEVLAVARALQPATAPAEFAAGDAFALDRVQGTFDAAFVGFWWSHVARADLQAFLTGLHRRLGTNGFVLVLDNRYVEGSNAAVTRTDAEGNTFQRRTLDSGAEFEIRKNFPTPDEVQAVISKAGGHQIVVRELPFYWYATYKVA